jgi:hypothetical protein
MEGKEKESIYNRLNEILELIENRQVDTAQSQIEGLINEIKYGIYG